MGTGTYFDISAFVVLLCLAYTFFLQRLDKVEDNNIIFAALLSELLSASLSLAFIFNPQIYGELKVPFYVSSWILTAVSIALTILFLFINRTYNIGIWKPVILVGVPFGLDIIFIICACFGLHNTFRDAAYFCDLVMFTVGICVLLIYKKTSSTERTILVFLTLVASLAATAVEMMYPEVEIQSFVIAMLLAEMFFSLKDPEDQFDAETGLLGPETFKEEIRRRYYYLDRHEAEVSMVLLIIPGSASFMKLLGEVNEMKLRQSVMSELKRISDGTELYKINQGVYVFLAEKGKKEEAIKVQRSIISRFEMTFGTEAYEMELPFCTSLIEIPKMAPDSTVLMDLIHMAMKEGILFGRKEIDATSLDLSSEEYMRQVDEKVRHAVESGNLEVYYQPIYSFKEKRFVSAEALLRLHDGETFIPPDLFITVAENNGSIVEIDDYVVQQVCKMISGRNLKDLGIRYIELNLSVSDMLQDDIAGKMKRMVEMYHVNPSQINLEITETSDDTFTGTVEANVYKLSKLGFNFSLDDFGTGYSSLSRIIMMPFDIIKLDKTIVQSPFMLEDEQDRENARTLLESSADMIHQIGAETVAEGVETKEQLDAMERLGVNFIQGFYFARPMPESDFINAVKVMNKK
ncbi:MAG: EAL domain-containing protein [Lachnospiraceae bacterium]|nr:EAL domain-containing protein [Lachnospiraceae bacterium]